MPVCKTDQLLSKDVVEHGIATQAKSIFLSLLEQFEVAIEPIDDRHLQRPRKAGMASWTLPSARQLLKVGPANEPANVAHAPAMLVSSAAFLTLTLHASA